MKHFDARGAGPDNAVGNPVTTGFHHYETRCIRKYMIK